MPRLASRSNLQASKAPPSLVHAPPPPNPDNPIILRQWQIRDMIYSDKLPDPESAKMLEGLDIAESGHWIEQLYWSWWQSFKNKTKGKYSARIMKLTTVPRGRAVGWVSWGCFRVHVYSVLKALIKGHLREHHYHVLLEGISCPLITSPATFWFIFFHTRSCYIA